MFKKHLAALAVAAAFSSFAVCSTAANLQGPTSSATPYYINVPSSVDMISLLTVGDSVNDKPDGVTPYRMVGIPDGLGAFDNNDGTITVLMNHELGNTSGVVRQHGAKGAFVSQWTIRKSDLKVLHGGDLIKQQILWNPATSTFAPGISAIARFCSADLAAPTAFYNSKTGKGYTGRIFMNGEETGNEGRSFATIVTGPGAGVSYELPSLGRLSYENSLASPFEQDKTVVISTDDSTPGQVYVYVGEKQSTGSEIEKAGLHGGILYGIKVNGFTKEDDAAAAARTTGIPSGTRFGLHAFGDVRTRSGAQLQADSVAAGVTEFLRPEDGAWDTRNPNVFYYVTTDRFDQTKDAGNAGTTIARSRLHKLTFDDIRDPARGGKIDQLIDGTGPGQMFDNITVDRDGNLILMEDPGNQQHAAKIWKYYPRTNQLVLLAQADPARFGGRNGATAIAPTAPFTVDEESSGIIEVTSLFGKGGDDDGHDRDDDDDRDGRNAWMKKGYRYYLGVVQAHYPNPDAELVEGGQLFLMGVPKNAR
jgi:Bacterial protein of unknown function (DUF839)